MKTTHPLLFAALLLACQFAGLLLACHGWNLVEGWTVTGANPEGLAIFMNVARERAPCRVEPWGGEVEFVPEPFDCGGVLAAGCWDGQLDPDTTARFRVLYNPEPVLWRGALRHYDRLDRTALMHELGRFLGNYCAGEHFREPDQEWVRAANAEAACRAGWTCPVAQPPPVRLPGTPVVTAVRHYPAGEHTDAGLTFNTHVHFDGTGEPGLWVQVHVDDEYLNLYGGTVASDGTWTAGPYDGEFITEGWHTVRVRLTTGQYEGWGIDGPLSEPRCFYFP